MKIQLWMVLTAATLVPAASQPMDRTFENARGEVNLLGLSSPERLTQPPFGEWYQEQYEVYDVNMAALAELELPDSITVFMGTWCRDSRMLVPPFMKMLDAKSYDLSRLKIINVNTGFQNYKQAPEREERGLYIHRVPTFIFHDSAGAEVGRIVQDPVASLEEDTRTLLHGDPYETSFPVAQDLIQKFKTLAPKAIRERMPELAAAYREQTASEGELRIFGYVMWSSFEFDKADILFEMNALLYPESVSACRMLVNFKLSYGRPEEARAYLEKGLHLDPEDARLLALQKKLDEE